MKREGENKERGKEGWGGRREGGRRKRGIGHKQCIFKTQVVLLTSVLVLRLCCLAGLPGSPSISSPVLGEVLCSSCLSCMYNKIMF